MNTSVPTTRPNPSPPQASSMEGPGKDQTNPATQQTSGNLSPSAPTPNRRGGTLSTKKSSKEEKIQEEKKTENGEGEGK